MLFRSFQPGDDAARQSDHKDIAHPITAECRDYIQKKVLEAYDSERKLAPSQSAASAVHSASPQVPRREIIEEENDIEL